MAMHIVNSGIDLAAIYRPQIIFLNPIMEKLEKNTYVKQVKKGVSGTKDLLKLFKEGTSIALMIDQRQGIKCDFLIRKPTRLLYQHNLLKNLTVELFLYILRG